MSLIALASAAASLPGAGYTHFTDLHLSPIAVTLGPLQVRWYSLGYIAGIMMGWWWLTKMLEQPGAPMAKRHADDFIFYLTLGIILGGRLFYVIFYDPWMLQKDPLQAFRLWDGGMSFHGGAIGSLIAVLWVSRRNHLSPLRFCDYAVCCASFGLFFVRIANFINGELWGRITTVPWAIVFPGDYAGPYPRHPSQLYEAALEGIVLFAVLNWMFWKTQARYKPGLLLGTFLFGYGLIRFALEFVRQPDEQLGILPWGLSMGQTLSAPMLIFGLYFILTAKQRKIRIEPFAGSASVA